MHMMADQDIPYLYPQIIKPKKQEIVISSKGNTFEFVRLGSSPRFSPLMRLHLRITIRIITAILSSFPIVSRFAATIRTAA
mmetsp:Transcript_22567/g.19563  ORF Transcript_22567/g.19563 Transcript_22567/m.19563 type:complete len:81 (-) Transcript_22567:823-1065(-)